MTDTDDAGFEYEITQYGFRWGPVEFTRLMSHPERGVVMRISTDSQDIEIYSSKGGRSLRVFNKRTHEELK